VISALERWAEWADGQRFVHPADSSLACYGPGYVHWGVQSNWNYAAALATLAAQPGVADAAKWRDRAVSALRYALATHITGSLRGNDGKQWGHTWISTLGIERAMHGIHHLMPFLSADDTEALRRVFVSEANWLYRDARRGNHAGVVGGKWGSSGKNAPESNIWCGSFLWRIAHAYPDEPDAVAWKDRAHEYFVNGISIEADANDSTLIAGKPIRERYAGANFFPNYALDHHQYLNVGYMAISMSNAAILHFDVKRDGGERPESLDHHEGDMWRVLRKMVFGDGRLARVGGDSRVRYAYGQEYLLPSLLYVADRFGDTHALDLARGQTEWTLHEAESNRDGSFYGSRLKWLVVTNPHYYTRIESDRAAVLAMLVNYLPLVDAPSSSQRPYDIEVAGEWIESEHGAALTRGEHRFASFSWRSQSLSQGLCVPPQRSDLAEWARNLCPVVRFLSDNEIDRREHRRLLRYTIASFDGGFVTCGSVSEGVNVSIDEGASCTDQAVTDIAFAALPDGNTCVVLQRVVTAPDRHGIITEVKGLHLNIPNDLFNGYRRTVASIGGTRELVAPVTEDEAIRVSGSWLNIDDVLGVVSLYGMDGFTIDRASEPRGGRYRSLIVDEVCSEIRRGPARVSPGEVLVDLGCAVVSDVDAKATAAVVGESIRFDDRNVRGVRVRGQDGVDYTVVANFGDAEAKVSIDGRDTLIPAGSAIVASADSAYTSQPPTRSESDT